MRKIILTLVPAIGLLLPLRAQAQGTLYLSNLGESSGGSVAVASNAWAAALFETGANSGGYTLNSIQLLMDAASGSPIGFNVLIYNFSGGNPQNNLGSLSGSDPTAGGLLNYTASSITLLPSTDYFIVLTAATPLASGSYYWSLADTANYSSSDGWSLASSYFNSIDGSSWIAHRSTPLQFAVYATEVPEPATYALAGLVLAAVSFWRRKP